jgi:hypothetical protein
MTDELMRAMSTRGPPKPDSKAGGGWGVPPEPPRA